MQDIKDYLLSKCYPGRGIIAGANEDKSKIFLAYFIMGRSENSRNRIFVQKNLDLYTEPFDESLVSDPSLIIYQPVKFIKDKYIIISNGDQTNTIYDYISKKKSFEDALKTRTFEPDTPNFTPRISLLLSLDDFSYKMSLIKKGKDNLPVHLFFEYEFTNSCSHLIHTYKDDGEPLPSFEGNPVLLRTPEDFNTFTDEVWDSLNADNRISLFTECIDTKTKKIETNIINSKA